MVFGPSPHAQSADGAGPSGTSRKRPAAPEPKCDGSSVSLALPVPELTEHTATVIECPHCYKLVFLKKYVTFSGTKRKALNLGKERPTQH